jgi:hypothetical protein
LLLKLHGLSVFSNKLEVVDTAESYEMVYVYTRTHLQPQGNLSGRGNARALN